MMMLCRGVEVTPRRVHTHPLWVFFARFLSEEPTTPLSQFSRVTFIDMRTVTSMAMVRHYGEVHSGTPSPTFAPK
jgi:hypothetical protein